MPQTCSHTNTKCILRITLARTIAQSWAENFIEVTQEFIAGSVELTDQQNHTGTQNAEVSIIFLQC